MYSRCAARKAYYSTKNPSSEGRRIIARADLFSLMCSNVKIHAEQRAGKHASSETYQVSAFLDKSQPLNGKASTDERGRALSFSKKNLCAIKGNELIRQWCVCTECSGTLKNNSTNHVVGYVVNLKETGTYR